MEKRLTVGLQKMDLMKGGAIRQTADFPLSYRNMKENF